MFPAPARRTTASRRLVALVLAGATLLAPLACSSDDGDEAEVETSIAESATVDRSSSTTEAATTSTAAGPVGVTEADQAASALYAAWKGDDRTAAGTVAEAAAVEGMWGTTPGDYALYNRCNTGEFGGASCLYRGPGGTIQFNMELRGDRWVVIEAVYSAP